MLFEYRTKSPLERYKLMSQSIIPRPIAWIVTEREGIVNAAPFSYFTGLSSQPPTVVVSVGHKSDGTPKDTLENLRRTGRCTLCMVDEAHLEQMHLSSKELSASESETERFDIALRRDVVEGFPPMVQGAPVALFCRLYREIDLEGSKTVPLILEILYHYVADDALKDRERLRIEWRPVARIGKRYALLGEEITPPPIS